jgi:hypothetical protein
MQFWWLPIALCIGALPSQTGPIAWQGKIVPDQQATNCPLSESSLTGLEFYGTVEAIRATHTYTHTANLETALLQSCHCTIMRCNFACMVVAGLGLKHNCARTCTCLLVGRLQSAERLSTDHRQHDRRHPIRLGCR